MSNQSRIYMTVFNFDEIWCVGLGSRVHVSYQVLGQCDLQIQRSTNFDPTLILDDFPGVVTPLPGDLQM